MKRNMGGVDRALRAVTALAILVAWLAGGIAGGWALALGVIAAVFVVTSTIGICPLYSLIGIDTIRGARVGGI